MPISKVMRFNIIWIVIGYPFATQGLGSRQLAIGRVHSPAKRIPVSIRIEISGEKGKPRSIKRLSNIAIIIIIMWLFYLISFPLTLGMVVLTLKYFAGPDVPRYVFFTVGYTWFCSISIIILVPADISSTIIGHDNGGISFFWSWSYWSTFLLTWLVVPLIQGFEDAGDFTVRERLKTSIHVNLVFYLILGLIGIFGLILLIMMRNDWSGGVLGLAMACSNTFGLVTGAFLLGFGLSEIPKTIWRNADWTTRQKVLSHKIAKMAVKLDVAHQELSKVIVVAQETSKQMSKRDPFRPYMDIIDDMIYEMLQEDPSFKPQGGRLGENDMDYDTDEKTMATLRRNLRGAREEYYRCKSQYLTYVIEALKLEDTIKNYEQRDQNMWKFVSSFRPKRSGTLGSYLDTMELIWRCIVWRKLQKLFAVILGSMSAAILLAEATLLPSVDLSVFSLLVNSFGTEDTLVQVIAFVPLFYMCICTYYSLFKIGMLMFYSFTPSHTSPVSLLMICSMVARYAPPISYNFLNLIRLDGKKKTIFEQRMGNIDNAVPFFGKGFNKLYPLIMVVYTILVASGFFHNIINFIGKWKRIALRNEDDDDLDGVDPSGLIILQKERDWLEQGHKIGEEAVPFARDFSDTITDMESGNSSMGRYTAKSKAASTSLVSNKNENESSSRHQRSREAMSSKYAAIREQTRQTSNDNISSTKVSLLDANTISGSPSPSKLSSTWSSMKSGLQNWKVNIKSKKYIPLLQVDDSRSSSDSLDEIFHKLKRPAVVDHGDQDERDEL